MSKLKKKSGNTNSHIAAMWTTKLCGMVVKLTAWWQSQVIPYYLTQGGPTIKCAFLKYYASVCCDGRRWVLMLGSRLVLCSRLQWGMSDRRLHPSVLQPVSVILQFRFFTLLPSSCSLLPLKGRCTDTGAVPLPLLWTFSFHMFFCTFSSRLSRSSFSRLRPSFPISSFSSSILNLSYWRCSAVSEPPASPFWAFPLAGQSLASLLYVWK